jgi:hypothetical protein
VNRLARYFAPTLLMLFLAACVSPPAAKYQPAIDNTRILLGQSARLAVGKFSAAPGVSNHALAVRTSELTGGGSDGAFSTYLHDAIVVELQTSGRYDDSSQLRISGVLTRNELSSGIATGTAAVGAEFALTRNDEVCFKKTLVAEHTWDSSFLGVVAIPAAFGNYPTTVQKLLGELFADPDFIAAIRASSGSPGS